MTEVFVDTFYWLAMINPLDVYHQRVSQAQRPSHMVTTWAIQLEVLDALSSPPVRPLAAQFWQLTKNYPSLVIVALTQDLLNRSIAFFEQHRDKSWSMTDCISFVVMKERAITKALNPRSSLRTSRF